LPATKTSAPASTRLFAFSTGNSHRQLQSRHLVFLSSMIFAELFHFLKRMRNKFLRAKARVYRHYQHMMQFSQNIISAKRQVYAGLIATAHSYQALLSAVCCGEDWGQAFKMNSNIIGTSLLKRRH
jgi:hypothetical protein